MKFWDQYNDNLPKIASSIPLAKETGLSVGTVMSFIEKAAPIVLEGVKLATLAHSPVHLPFVLLEFSVKTCDAVSTIYHALRDSDENINKPTSPRP